MDQDAGARLLAGDPPKRRTVSHGRSPPRQRRTSSVTDEQQTRPRTESEARRRAASEAWSRPGSFAPTEVARMLQGSCVDDHGNGDDYGDAYAGGGSAGGVHGDGSSSSSSSSSSSCATSAGSIDARLQLLFCRFGRWLVTLSGASLALAIGCCLVCVLGLAALGVEEWKLDTGTESFTYLAGNARKDQAFSDGTFGEQPRMETLILTARNHAGGGGPNGGTGGNGPANLLDARALSDVYALDAVIRAVSVPDPESGAPVTFEDLCARQYGDAVGCNTMSPTAYWADEAAMLADASTILIHSGDGDSANVTALSRTLSCINPALLDTCTSLGPPGEVGQPIVNDFVLGKGAARNVSHCAVYPPADDDDPDPKYSKPLDCARQGGLISFVPAFNMAYMVAPPPGVRFTEAFNARAAAWETAMVDAVLAWNAAADETDIAGNGTAAPKPRLITANVNAQNSVETEVAKLVEGDMPLIFLSYMAMGFYVSYALGRTPCADRLHSRTWLGFMAVMVVMLSVAGGGAICLLCGRAVNGFVLEVVPFLVLALGTDFSFQISDALERAHLSPGGMAEVVTTEGFVDDVEIELRMAEDFGAALSEAGPSIVLATLIECSAFAVGTMIPFRALSAVCAFCCASVAVNGALQLTLFAMLCVADCRRALAGRNEVLCCATMGVDALEKARDGRLHARSGLRSFFRDTYFPALASPRGRLATVAATVLACGLVGVRGAMQLSVEFKETDLLDERSYLVPYFAAQDTFFGIGPPLFLVLRGAAAGQTLFGNATSDPAADAAARAARADQVTLSERVRNSSYTFPGDTFDWLGDWQWFNSQCNGAPAFYNSTLPGFDGDMTTGAAAHAFLYHGGQFTPTGGIGGGGTGCTAGNPGDVPSPPQCPDWQDAGDSPKCLCTACSAGASVPPPPSLSGRAHTAPFVFCQALCQLRSVHRTNAAFEADNATLVGARLQSYLVQLGSMETYVGAMTSSYDLADAAPGALGGGATFATSVYFQYYEQYLVIVGILEKLFAISIALALFLAASVLCDLWAAGVLLLVVLLIMVNVLGMLYWWDVGLNSTTATNLVVGVGIAIEFCIHIVRHFSASALVAVRGGGGKQGTAAAGAGAAGEYPSHGRPSLAPTTSNVDALSDRLVPTRLSRYDRVESAMVEVGTTTFSGIFLTKFFGVSVLVLAKSRSTRVYFFRTFFSFVIFGGFHALVLLPVLLLMCGDAGRRKRGGGEGGNGDDEMSHHAAEPASIGPMGTDTGNAAAMRLASQDGIAVGV